MSHEEKHCKGSGTLWQVEGKSGEVSKDTLAKRWLQTYVMGGNSYQMTFNSVPMILICYLS